MHTKWAAFRPYFYTTLLFMLMTMLLKWSGLAFDLVNIALLYLLPVLINASYWGKRPSFYAAVAGVLIFNFFFVPPLLNFTVADLRHLISFAVYLTVASLTASLAVKLKAQVQLSKRREAQTAALYTLSKQIGTYSDLNALLAHFARQVSEAWDTEIAVYLTKEGQQFTLVHRSYEPNAADKEEKLHSSVSEAYQSGQSIARADSQAEGLIQYFIPLRTEERIFGVMILFAKRSADESREEQILLLEALGGLAASAVARILLEEEAKLAHVTAESERLRTAILNSVSHELRTPLAAIIGSATSLIEGDHLFSAEDRMELLMNIRDGALRMNRLVVNLLGMARLESGLLRLRKDWCSIEELIGVTLSQLQDFREHRKFRVELPDDSQLVVRGDEVLLEQMLVNIVSNAIKYSPDRSEILITAQALEDVVSLSIADQGMGIEVEEYEQIFEKFYRSEAAKQVSGTGLGLSISKGIAELHEGAIVVRSNPPRGTVITVTLPLSKPLHVQHESERRANNHE